MIAFYPLFRHPFTYFKEKKEKKEQIENAINSFLTSIYRVRWYRLYPTQSIYFSHGSCNTALGYSSGINTTGQYNTFVSSTSATIGTCECIKSIL